MKYNTRDAVNEQDENESHSEVNVMWHVTKCGWFDRNQARAARACHLLNSGLSKVLKIQRAQDFY